MDDLLSYSELAMRGDQAGAQDAGAWRQSIALLSNLAYARFLPSDTWMAAFYASTLPAVQQAGQEGGSMHALKVGATRRTGLLSQGSAGQASSLCLLA